MSKENKSGGLGVGIGGGTGFSTNIFSDDWVPSITDPSLFNNSGTTDWTTASVPEFKIPDFKITDADISSFFSKNGGGLSTATSKDQVVKPPPGDESWFNSGNLSAAAGLASALTQAIALPDQLKNMRLQRKSMQHNLDTAKQEQARRNNNISGFNSFSNIKGA